MDDLTIADLGYVCGRVIYDDAVMDDIPKIMRKSMVKAVLPHMSWLTREHINWPFEAVRNYDY